MNTEQENQLESPTSVPNYIKDQFHSEEEVLAMTGFKQATLKNYSCSGRFPKPVYVGKQRYWHRQTLIEFYELKNAAANQQAMANQAKAKHLASCYYRSVGEKKVARG